MYSSGLVYFLLWYGVLHWSEDVVYGSLENGRELHSNVDIVGFAVKPTCVTKKAIYALNEHFSPRRIIVITTSESACLTFSNFAKNIECLVESNLLPGVCRNSIDQFLMTKYANYVSGVFKGRDVAAWYLQQFLKMGASSYIHNLSEYHLIWDLDMILIKDLYIFRRGHDKIKTIVNIGGLNSPGYDLSYQNLTGNKLLKASDGSSFVTHWMVVYKPFMDEFTNFLASKSRPSYSPTGTPWVWSVLNALPEQRLHMGFSEYASYASWILTHHPDSVYVENKKTWSRYPVGGTIGMALLAYWSEDKLCCPQTTMVKTMQNLGYQYFGMEIGHQQACRYDNDKFVNGYGI
eukprot:g8200.t1